MIINKYLQKGTWKSFPKLGVKCKPKKKVYRLMTTQGKVNMPPIKLSNHKYVARAIEGRVKVSQDLDNSSLLFHQNIFN